MPENNPDPAPARPRFAWTRKNKLIAAAMSAVLIVGGGTAIGVTTYTANTRAMCQEAADAYAGAHTALAGAHAMGQASITRATDIGGVEYITGFVSTEEQKAADGYEPSEGDALTAAVTASLEDGALPADATVACSTRDEAADITAQAETMAGQATAITDASSALDEAVYAYQTTKIVEAAQKSLSDGAASRDEAVTAAQAAIDSANAGEGYLSGFKDTDEGKALVADAQSKLDAAKAVDTDAAAATREEAEAVTAKVQPVADATKALNDAVSALNGKAESYRSTKQAEAEAAAAAQAQAQRSQSSSGSSGSNRRSSSSGSSGSNSSGSSNRGSTGSGSSSSSGSSGSSGSSSNSGSSNSGSSGSTGGSGGNTGGSSGGSGTPSTCTEGRVVNLYIGDKVLTVKCVGGSWVDVP